MNTKLLPEMLKALLGLVGLVLLLLCMALLAPEARADAFPTSQIASYLSADSALPLAVGVPMDLAVNLVDAQREAWGARPALWQPGSLLASENAVLKAITLYVWPGGPTLVTTDQQAFEVVWIQSNIAVDPRLTGGFSVTSFDFGAKAIDPPVVTPEPSTWLLMLIGLAALYCYGRAFQEWQAEKSSIAKVIERMRARLAAYRAVQP
jgi:hypothetical protein